MYGLFKVSKKLAILASIYQLGYINEEEYGNIKRKIIKEYNMIGCKN